jgi:putative transcriptional regulator
MEVILTGEFIRALRLSLNMSQEKFCESYHIPIAALRNWEQNRRTPDPATQSFLYVIEAIPSEVEFILANLHK